MVSALQFCLHSEQCKGTLCKTSIRLPSLLVLLNFGLLEMKVIYVPGYYIRHGGRKWTLSKGDTDITKLGKHQIHQSTTSVVNGWSKDLF